MERLHRPEIYSLKIYISAQFSADAYLEVLWTDSMYECFSNENVMVEITLRNDVVGRIFKASAIYPISTGF